MPRPPSIQWYYKQYLGDNKVLAMDWDARGMHVHLLMLSIQEEPPGTIPADDAAIRRWLSLPLGSVDADQTWRRVKSQLLAAWQPEGDRLVNSGMKKACDRRDTYLNRYESGTKRARDSMPTEHKVELDVDSKKESVAPNCEVFHVEHDNAPEGFGASALAVGLLGKIGMPNSVGNIKAAASAIETAARELEVSHAKGCDWLLSRARDAQERGEQVNRFWFEDGMQKWESEGNEQPNKARAVAATNLGSVVANRNRTTSGSTQVRKAVDPKGDSGLGGHSGKTTTGGY